MTSPIVMIDSVIKQLKTNKDKKLLDQLKGLVYSLQTLPPSTLPPNTQEYVAARSAFEAEMDYYLNIQNEKGFENAYLQTKLFYFDSKTLLEKSQRMEYFVGLYLLHLLCENRNSEYCSELELLDLSQFSNEFISLPVEIEHSISEGNYNKLIVLQNSLTDPVFKHYLNRLNSSVRVEIARSAEKSLRSISIKDACELLFFTDANQLMEFVNQENQKSYDSGNQEILWVLQEERLSFKEVTGKDRNVVPSNKIMSDTINLAYEVEKII